MELVQTRKVDGKKQYFCKICDSWVGGTDWRGTGYPQLICADCSTTLDDDYLGYWAYEAGLLDEE